MPNRDRQARQRETAASKPQVGPGSAIRHYFGDVLGWPLRCCNVIVEGTTDVSHFAYANELYRKSTDRVLLDADLSIIAVGERDKGGTKWLVKRFQAIYQMMQDNPPDGDDPLAFLALLDDDNAGRLALNVLTSAVGLQEFRDVLMLCRVLPRKRGNPLQLAANVKTSNAEWLRIPCEVEDLLSADVLDCFAEDNPGSLLSKPVRVGSGHHYEWRGDMKPALARYVREYAILEDVNGIVEFLKSLRFLFRLDPDGTPETGQSTKSRQ